MSDEQEAPPQIPAEPGDARRQEDGRFGPGNNANAGGRPKALKDVQERAQEYTVESIRTLVNIMRVGMQKPRSTARMREARYAAVALLDRGWGKPAQPISGVPGQPVEIGGEAVLNILKTIAGEKEPSEG